jgi:hypothetical protein
METLVTTEAPQVDTGRMEEAVHKVRQRDAMQSTVVAVIVVAMLGLILALIAILPPFREVPVIVTYAAPKPEKEEPSDRPDLAKGMRPKPTSSSSASARVIAAQMTAPVAVPMPDNPVQTGPFGIDDDFNAGFGAGDGDGDGGGGATFFGTPRKGRRVIYVVDFSKSMESDAAGGTRIAALKKELLRSIKELPESMNFNVIFFSHHGWTIDQKGVDEGWNGLGKPLEAVWYPAAGTVKDKIMAEIQAMPPGGNTQWYPPLKMAFSMMPPPDIVFLLSDGEPRDFNQVMDELGEINPTGVPVDTIAFELPGTPARMMMEVANTTGGKFTLVYNGKRLSGMAAEKLTGSEHDFGP